MCLGQTKMEVTCRKMTIAQQNDAEFLLNSFLRNDSNYLATRAIYGDRGPLALRRALALFSRRKNLGFVWLAYLFKEPVAVCVVSFAISTSIGGLVAKLDDVYVASHVQHRGVASQMLEALIKELKRNRIRRIDTSVYKRNRKADRFYKKMGFKDLGEERLALILL